MGEREIKYRIIIQARGCHKYHDYLYLLETLSREYKKPIKTIKKESKKMITSIYIKPSKRKCSVSDYRCFDIYDQDMNLIPMKDCDVIDIEVQGMVHLEVVNGMTHIWSHQELEFELLINTLTIKNK